VAVLERATGLHAAFGRTLDYDGGQYGIALLSRWPISDDTLVSLPVEPPQRRAGGSYEPRGALIARATAPDLVARLLDTHLDASGDDHYRRQEIAVINRLLAALVADSSGGATRLVLAGGDFNAEPGSAVHAAALSAGWRDAWLECGDGTPGLTFPARAPVKRIDYLWLTGRARCTSARVVGGEASDHRGVLVTVVP
jgi:endonuclease/exonuclease/phosphatase family metal-dependent hydrolase